MSMAPETQVLLSGALTFGAPLVLAVRELILLRRRPPGNDGPPPPERVPEPPRPKPLPDCLVPKLRPRVRELEDA